MAQTAKPEQTDDEYDYNQAVLGQLKGQDAERGTGAYPFAGVNAGGGQTSDGVPQTIPYDAGTAVTPATGASLPANAQTGTAGDVLGADGTLPTTTPAATDYTVGGQAPTAPADAVPADTTPPTVTTPVNSAADVTNDGTGTGINLDTSTGLTPDTYSTPTVSTVPANQANQGVDDATRQKLIALMSQDPYATSVNDPSIKPAADAYAQARNQALDRQRGANAERMAAQGLGSSGALDQANAGAFESAGQDIASEQANLVTQQITAKRQDVQNALTAGQGILTADQTAQLQMQLANYDKALRERALQLQANSLQQQNQQFYDNLGYQVGVEQANLNNAAGS